MNEPETIGEIVAAAIMRAPAKLQLRRYKVILCDRCHVPINTSAQDMVKCEKCGRTNRFFTREGHLRSYFLQFDRPHDAANAVIDLGKITAKMGNDWRQLMAYFNEKRRLQ